MRMASLLHCFITSTTLSALPVQCATQTSEALAYESPRAESPISLSRLISSLARFLAVGETESKSFR